MNVEVKYSESMVPVNWNWPVQIGFLNGLIEPNTLTEFKKNHWLDTLAHGYKMSRVRHTSNILVLYGTIEEVSLNLRTNSFAIKTDLLVLFIKPGADTSLDVEKAIEEFQNVYYNSFFATVVPKGRSYLFWLNELIYQLSHNLEMVEAIERIGGRGKLVVSRELIYDSRVTNVLDKMLDEIVTATEYENYKFNEVLTDQIRGKIDSQSKGSTKSVGNSPSDILEDVRMRKESFEFQNETDESSIIKDIAIKHSANVSDMMGKMGTKAEEEAARKAGARYLQYVFKNPQQEPIHHALVINQPYTLTVLIDALREGFMQGGIVSKDDVEVKKGEEQRVDILLRYRDEMDQKNIMLPHAGSSTEAIFDVNIAEEGETHFEIFAFHKNRLFQQIDLSVFFCENEGKLGSVPSIKMEMINMPRTTLSDFDLKEKYGLSMVFTDGFPVIAQEAGIEEIADEEHINKFNEQLTAIIEKYVKSRNPNNEDLIFALAEQGAVLYKNLFAGKDVFDQPIQIISSSAKHFPLEFLYTHKLHRKAEKLCPNAAAALEKGTCAGCNDGDEKYICPFGFAALRTVIERHRIGENVDQIGPNSVGLKTDVNMNRPAIPILTNTLFGTSERVDKSEAGLRELVGQEIKNCSETATEAKDWDNWIDSVETKKPDSLIIIGHVEPSSRGGSKQLEIGSDLLRQAVIDDELVLAPDAVTNPFMVLIGCNTQDVEMSFMDFSSQFKNCGAAIVLSTFTKIRGSHAVPLVVELLKILHSKKGGEEIRFGDAMLELRRKLFAKGLYVSMAMVSHGDADWKLKI